MSRAAIPIVVEKKKVRSQVKGRVVDPRALAEVSALLGDTRRDLLIDFASNSGHYHCISRLISWRSPRNKTGDDRGLQCDVLSSF
jgi:hypothetical protein